MDTNSGRFELRFLKHGGRGDSGEISGGSASFAISASQLFLDKRKLARISGQKMIERNCTEPAGSRRYVLICPVPSITNLYVQSSLRPIGPRAWRRSVLMPISAP